MSQKLNYLDLVQLSDLKKKTFFQPRLSIIRRYKKRSSLAILSLGIDFNTWLATFYTLQKHYLGTCSENDSVTIEGLLGIKTNRATEYLIVGL